MLIIYQIYCIINVCFDVQRIFQSKNKDKKPKPEMEVVQNAKSNITVMKFAGSTHARSHFRQSSTSLANGME